MSTEKTFLLTCTATATIRERWLVKATSARNALDQFEAYGTMSGRVAFLDEQVADDERDREPESVATYDGKWPDEPDDAADAARLVLEAAPAMLEFLKMLAGLETATEFDDRTGDEGMSGDDAVETVSSIVSRARELVAKAEGAAA